MPGLDGLEVTRQLAGPDVNDPIKVVVVTTFDLDEYVHTTLRNGASGFLLKDAGPALLVEAVRAADRGDALVSPQVTVRLLKHFDGSSAKRNVAPPNEPLTGREGRRARPDEHRDRCRAVSAAVHGEDAPGRGAGQDQRAEPG
jgi:DNA-binding NarL/FixJ family response regulator